MRTSTLTVSNLEPGPQHIVHRFSAAWSADPGECGAAAPLTMSPGASAEKMHLFVAEYGPGDRVGRDGGVAGEGERIELLELPLARAWEMVAVGGINDAKTVLLQHARLNGGTL